MGSLKFPHASGNSMSIAAPATNPASDLELKLPATVGTAGQVLANSSTPGTLEFAGNTPMFLAAPTIAQTGLSSASNIKADDKVLSEDDDFADDNIEETDTDEILETGTEEQSS